MGPTGTGKSSFISTVVGQDKGVGHNLESCTSDVSAVRVQVPGEDFKLVLVDTPGFDDTHKSDYQILELISDWLERTGKKKILLSGILYLHRISDNRMAGTPLKNLKMFEKLCGRDACSQIIMVTTMWGELANRDIGHQREEELKSTFWAPMIKRGSSTARYQGTTKSAWDILEHFLSVPRERQELQLQKELVELQKALPSTAAGKELSKAINEFVNKQESLMRTLQTQMHKPDADKEIVALLRGQYEELERQRQNLMGDVEALRVPLKKKLRDALAVQPRHLKWFKQES
ncbi:hypothetical protein P691DRAFT_672718 [Macrolepiota fuliginosa MF-IS2]|uniref:G domain-containing protein n=2 Tax=Macrolepiota fuliginosa MF-IS2 TaxID=1400762 RepID=A0A9P6C2Z2_9AGAR|nr:hypothetical protein P691DRAFT_672718 [Macrolepiota fuliginosa MF-IS2]